MKIVFEYEDGTYRIVPRLKYRTIEERNPENSLLDEYIVDEHKTKYIIANDNHIGGFEGHKDLLELQQKIKELERQLNYIKQAFLYYEYLDDEL